MRHFYTVINSWFSANSLAVFVLGVLVSQLFRSMPFIWAVLLRWPRQLRKSLLNVRVLLIEYKLARLRRCHENAYETIMELAPSILWILVFTFGFVVTIYDELQVMQVQTLSGVEQLAIGKLDIAEAHATMHFVRSNLLFGRFYAAFVALQFFSLFRFLYRLRWFGESEAKLTKRLDHLLRKGEEARPASRPVAE